MRRLLLTGASGLLGAALTYQGRHKFDLLACTHTARLQPIGFQTHAIDLTDANATSQLVQDFSPDWICHCAALTDVDRCEQQPERAKQMNVDTTEVLARAATQCGARLLLISTDSVFDGQRSHYTETDLPAPVNQYAASKLAAEQITRTWAQSYLIARVNFYGWNLQPKNSLAEWVLNRLQQKITVPSWTDVFFTPIFTLDLADILLNMMSSNMSGLYHIAGERCSKYEFARAIAEEWTLNGDLIIPTLSTSAALLAPRPRDTSLCGERLGSALVRSLPDLKSGLHHMRQWRETEMPSFKQLLA